MKRIFWTQEIKTSTHWRRRRFLWWKWNEVAGTSSELRHVGTIDFHTSVYFVYKNKSFISLHFEREGEVSLSVPMRNLDPFGLKSESENIADIKKFIEDHHVRLYPRKYYQ